MKLRTLALAYFAVVASGAQAFEIQRVDEFVSAPDNVVQEQLVVVARTIDFKGTALDDVFFVAGDNVSITGRLMNDVWVLARSVHLGATVDDHVRLLANTITFSGAVTSSFSAVASSTVQIMTNAVVGGSLNLMAENAIVEGAVSGHTRIMAQRVTLAGRMLGDVTLAADDIVVLAGTVIQGDLIYTSDRELFLDKGVQLGGKLVRKTMTKPTSDISQPSVFQLLTVQISLCLAAILVGIVFIWLFPGFAGTSILLIRQSLWKCALAGLIGFCLIPLACVLLFMSLVGLPLAFLLAMGFLMLLYLSKIVVALALGQLLLRRSGNSVLVLITGLVLLYFMAVLPIVGLSIVVAVMLVGLGAIVTNLFGLRQAGAATPPPADASDHTQQPTE